jgi:predicted small integral membrane protein
MGRTCSINGRIGTRFRLLVGKPEGKRLLGIPRHKWVDNIRMDLLAVGWGDIDWIGLAQEKNRWRAVVNSVMNLRVP